MASILRYFNELRTWSAISGADITIQPSSTAQASLNIPPGTAPTSPVDGDLWYDGTNLKFRVGGVTKTVTLT